MNFRSLDRNQTTLAQNQYRSSWIGAILTTATVLVFCHTLSAQGTDPAKEVVAKVGDQDITLKEFNERFDQVVAATPNPPDKAVFLEDLIRYKIGMKEADKKKVADNPIIKERLNQEIYKGFVELEIGKKVSEIKVSDQEMQAYYKKNPEVRTSHILIEFRPDATAEQKKAARKRAEEILAEVKKGKRPFEEYVSLYTDDVLSKRTGGDINWQGPLSIVPQYYEVARAMKVGEIKGLIETQFGFHILKKTGQRTYQDAVKANIRSAVFEQKRKALFDQLFNGLKRKYPVKVFADKLK